MNDIGPVASITADGVKILTTGANAVKPAMEEAAAGATTFGAALQTALPWILGITAAIFVIKILDDIIVTTAEAKENVKNLYAEIYNRQENVDNVKDLVEQYKELDKQVVKTTDDYEELASLQQQIIEATENPNLFTVSGGIDDEVYQK